MNRLLKILIVGSAITFLAATWVYNTKAGPYAGMFWLAIIPLVAIGGGIAGLVGGSIAAWIHVSKKKKENQESHRFTVFAETFLILFFFLSLLIMFCLNIGVM